MEFERGDTIDVTTVKRYKITEVRGRTLFVPGEQFSLDFTESSITDNTMRQSIQLVVKGPKPLIGASYRHTGGGLYAFTDSDEFVRLRKPSSSLSDIGSVVPLARFMTQSHDWSNYFIQVEQA